MYRIINTATRGPGVTYKDYQKQLLHRTAPKFEEEPSLGGVRIRIGCTHDITDAHYSRVKPTLDEWVKKGMVDVIYISDEDVKKNEGLDKTGPTFEEWTAAGYAADKYPPAGYSEVFSPGLVSYKRSKEEKAVELTDPANHAEVEKIVTQAKENEEPIIFTDMAGPEPKTVVIPPSALTPPPASASVKPFKKK